MLIQRKIVILSEARDPLSLLLVRHNFNSDSYTYLSHTSLRVALI